MQTIRVTVSAIEVVFYMFIQTRGRISLMDDQTWTSIISGQRSEMTRTNFLSQNRL
jgi:hypothetical protein